MDDLPLFWQQIIDCRTAKFIVVRTHAAGRFVQRDVKFLPGADDFAVQNHLVAVGINLRSQQADELAVDADFAVQNDLLRRAPRSDARVG